MVGAIERGILVFVGVERGDGESQAERLAERILGYRVFADEQGRKLWELGLDDLRAIDERIEADVFNVLSPDGSVKSRTSHGGTAPAQVKKRFEAARKVLGMDE